MSNFDPWISAHGVNPQESTMSAAVNAVHADFLKQFLNQFAGQKQTLIELIIRPPAKLWIAVLRLAAYQIYQINGLGLLANYSCTSATASSNLQEDDTFAGTAVVNPIPATGQMLVAGCVWLPRDASGNAISNPKAAVRGTLAILDYNGDFHGIQTRVVQQPDGNVLLEVDGPPPPSSGGGYDYEDGDDIAV
jgi:hypothetical protein